MSDKDTVTECGVDIPDNKSARITFRNGRKIGTENLRSVEEQEYYDAYHCVRDYLHHDTFHAFGQWAVAMKKAHYEEDTDKAAQIIEDLLRGYTDQEVQVTFRSTTDDEEVNL